MLLSLLELQNPCMTYDNVKKSGRAGEILTRQSARNGGGETIVHQHRDMRRERVLYKSLKNNDIQNFSFFTFYFSFPKHICFACERYMFRVVKDKLSGCERPSFGR